MIHLLKLGGKFARIYKTWRIDLFYPVSSRKRIPGWFPSERGTSIVRSSGSNLVNYRPMKFDWKSSVRSLPWKVNGQAAVSQRPLYTLQLSARWIISNFPCGELLLSSTTTLRSLFLFLERNYEITGEKNKFSPPPLSQKLRSIQTFRNILFVGHSFSTLVTIYTG